jgi:hypothetical protein
MAIEDQNSGGRRAQRVFLRVLRSRSSSIVQRAFIPVLATLKCKGFAAAPRLLDSVWGGTVGVSCDEKTKKCWVEKQGSVGVPLVLATWYIRS